jgi:hypothetical protein
MEALLRDKYELFGPLRMVESKGRVYPHLGETDESTKLYLVYSKHRLPRSQARRFLSRIRMLSGQVHGGTFEHIKDNSSR